MDSPPILLFVYKRAAHTARTLEALQNNRNIQNHKVIIYSDGPKNDEDKEAVNTVRKLIQNLNGFSVEAIVEHEHNLGLATSIKRGVSEALQEESSAIVLEDDLVTAPFFLDFMSTALRVYRDEPQVMHINGYCPPLPINDIPTGTFFYRLTSSWGWATWKDRWEQYQDNAATLYTELNKRGLLPYFDIDNAFRFSSTLKANANGYIDTWAIKWYASTVLSGGLSLYPRQTLVENIGHDGSGEHAEAQTRYDSPISETPISVIRQPVEECANIDASMRSYYKSIRPSMLEKFRLLLQLHIKPNRRRGHRRNITLPF